MNHLDDFHEKNWQRMHEAFAPAHSPLALTVCVTEELGELSSAVLAITGEKKRKAHLTKDDALDAVAYAFTYLSLYIRSYTKDPLSNLLASPRDRGGLLEGVAQAQHYAGALAGEALMGRSAVRVALLCAESLLGIAERLGCKGPAAQAKLIGDTFNMVSDRAGSIIKTTLGQQ